jgi:hypothetical protein
VIELVGECQSIDVRLCFVEESLPASLEAFGVPNSLLKPLHQQFASMRQRCPTALRTIHC